MSRAGIALILVAFLLILACQKKNLSTSKLSFSTSSNDTLITDTTNVDSLSYGDSVFSVSVTGIERRILPIVKPSQPGYFIANLSGLILDSATGRINLSRSESGLRYKVYYMSFTKELIAETSVTISGVDYQDRIYDLSSQYTEDLFATPIYNMIPGTRLPCTIAGSGYICKFDVTDINGDDIPDYIGANNSKLFVDTLTGVIDLKKSVEAGVFGPIPAGSGLSILNGRKKDITIYYVLGDSTRTLKKITVRLVYFQSKALIPESMQLEIDSRNKRYLLQPGSAASSGDDLLSLSYYYSTPKRPPLIVIVSGY